MRTEAPETGRKPEVAARCDELVKTYRTASGEVRALKGLSAEVPASSLLAVVGPSGSGKSSLLRLIAGLDRPTSGTLVVEGTSVHDASARTLRRFRRATVGYLFQRPSDNFLPHLTVGEHLRLARGLTHRPPRIDQEVLLSTLGIEERVDHLPSELSGGEQQRAAIAEVLMGGATIVVADEPTAELDSTSASHVMDTMVELARAGVTFVVATHDRSVMRRADAALELDHGIRRSSTSAPADPADRSSRRRVSRGAERGRTRPRRPVAATGDHDGPRTRAPVRPGRERALEGLPARGRGGPRARRGEPRSARASSSVWSGGRVRGRPRCST